MSKRKEKRKYLAGFLAAVSLAAVSGAVPAYGARDVEVDRLCSLTVNIGQEGSYREDLETARWDTQLYRIASVDEKGLYTAAEGFQSLEEDIDSVETAQDWDAVAQRGVAIIENSQDQIQPEATISIEGGTGMAEDLETGLYLLLSDTAVTEYYEYTFQPGVALLPGPEYEGSETRPQGEWVYDQSIVLKPEQSPRYGSLQVLKSLDSYNASLGPVTFVFQIEGVNEAGEKVYSNVVATTHSSAGTQAAVAEGIPAGTRVTVTEVYSGASYELVSSGSQTGVILADQQLSMEFSNTYNDELIPGYGAVNNFQYDENSGWQWSRLEDNAAVSE